MKSLRYLALAVLSACTLGLITAYGAHSVKLALWLGLGGGIVVLFIVSAADRTRPIYFNRFQFGTWLDDQRGRLAPLGPKQRVYFEALQEERKGCVRDREPRSRLRDIDREIRRVRLTGSLGPAVGTPAHEVAGQLIKESKPWWRRFRG